MYLLIVRKVRSLFISVPFLVILALIIMVFGVYGSLTFTSEHDWLNTARVLAGLPVLCLLFRSFIRQGPSELYEQKLTHKDASIRFEDGAWHGLSKAKRWTEQIKDGGAKQAAFYISILVILYILLSPTVIEWVKL